MKKKSLIVLLFVVCSICQLSADVVWRDQRVVDAVWQFGFEYYILENGTAAVVDMDVAGSTETMAIASSVLYGLYNFPVKYIDMHSAHQNSIVKNLIIPSSVVEIIEGSFIGFSALQSITIPESVEIMGSGVFAGCTALTSVNWNAKNCSIDGSPWWRYYDYDIFDKCPIKTIVFGEQVQTIPYNLCTGLELLTSITWNAINYGGEDGYYSYSSLFSNIASQINSFTFGDQVQSIPSALCSGMTQLTAITIPNSVTTIGGSAFSSCTGLTSVTIPNSVTTIGSQAFYGCSNLTSITWNAKNCENFSNSYHSPFSDIASQINSFTFGDQVETIPSYLCSGMTQLTAITIPNSVTTIGSQAFYGCSNLTSITWNAKNCENFSYSYNSPFYDIASQITSFTFGDQVETIPSYLCYGMSQLTSITIPNSVTTIGDHAFYNCSGLTSVTIPNSVTTIEDYAFDGCSGLTSVTIGNSVTTIGGGAFYDCSGLTSVTIGKSVTTIGSQAFFGCSGLEGVYITDLAAWCKIHYGGYYYGTNPLKYASTLYLNNQPLTDIVIPNTVDSIQYNAFGGYQGLTSLTVPSSVKYIGESAFYECSNLSILNLNDGLQNIDQEAFYGTAISSIRLPQSVRYVNWGAFAGCKQVHKVEILGDITWQKFETEEDEEDFYEEMQYNLNYSPLSYASWYYLSAFPLLDTIIAPASVMNLPEVAWSAGTKSLKYVKVNSGELSENALQYINRSYKTLKSLDVSSVSNIEFADEAFKGYYNLETLLLPGELQRISYMMVAGCKNLQSIDIPASVEEIDQSAFEDCRSIQTITFGGVASAPSRNVTNATSQLKKIGNWAFYNAHELQHLDIPEGVEEIGDAAFYGCTYLEDLALPASMRTIGDNCFALCSKLKRITSSAIVPPAVCARTFYDVNRQIPVYVPNESVTAYNTDIYWQEFNIQGGAATDLETMHGSQFTNSPVHQFTKYVKDGRLLIERNGILYNAHGARVK